MQQLLVRFEDAGHFVLPDASKPSRFRRLQIEATNDVLLDEHLRRPCKCVHLLWWLLEQLHCLLVIFLACDTHEDLHELVASQRSVWLQLDHFTLSGYLLQLTDQFLGRWTR